MVKNLKIDWDIAKDAHSKAKKDHKKENDNETPHLVVIAASTALDKACGVWEEGRRRNKG